VYIAIQRCRCSKQGDIVHEVSGTDDELTDAALLLAGGLVEPCLDIVLPVLLEVPVGDNVVVLHFDPFLSCLPAKQHNNNTISKARHQNRNRNQRCTIALYSLVSQQNLKRITTPRTHLTTYS
jgi:hypothetical protein